MPTHLFKQVVDILVPSLTKLVNLSLGSGAFPDAFKLALVSPLLKKSNLDPEVMTNQLYQTFRLCLSYLKELWL